MTIAKDPERSVVGAVAAPADRYQSGFNTDNEILYAGGRIKLMPFLYINAAAQRWFRVGFDDDDIAQPATDQDLRFISAGFENIRSGTFDGELGDWC